MRRWLRYTICVIAVAGVYCSNLRLIAAGDSLPTALVSLAAITDGTTRLDEYAPWLRTALPWTTDFVLHAADGSYRSIYPVAQGLLAAPLMAPTAWIFGVDDWEVPSQIVFARAAEKGIAALLAALAVLVMYLALRQIAERKWALIVSAVFAFGTGCWPIASQALWQHNGGLLFLTLSLYLWIRWERQRDPRLLFALGAACAVAAAIRPTNAIFVAPFLLLLRDWKLAGAVLAAPVIIGSAVVAYNWTVFGNLMGGYARLAAINTEPFTAFAGLLISPGRGLLIFSPVFLFSFVPLFRKGRSRPLVLVCFASIALHLLVISMWVGWHGGWAWGPRLLSEIVPHFTVLLALAVPMIQRYAMVFGVLAALSILIQSIGVYCYPGGAWDALPRPVDAQRVWDWSDDPIRRAAAAGLAKQPYQLAGKLLSRESFNAAATWQQVPPQMLAMYHWWEFPPRAPEPRLQRVAEQTCLPVSMRVKTGETGSPLWLQVTGEASMDSGKIPAEVYVELSSPGRPYTRTRALGPPVQAPYTADVLLDQPPAAQYEVKVIAVRPDRISECHAGKAQIETLRTLR